MDEYIKNISAMKTPDGNVSVTWVWPMGYNCVRVVFLHRLGGKDVTALSPDELASASDLCFMDEFQIAGGKYVFPVGGNDAGLLRFRVYCCESPDNMLMDKSSGTAQVTGRTLYLRYRTNAVKSGKRYKKVSFSVTSDASVLPGTLAYRVGSAPYSVNIPVPAGASVIGPVIVGANDDITLGLAAGHENELEIQTE